MSFSKKNPIHTDSWNKLKEHYNHISEMHLYDMFLDNQDRTSQLSIAWEDFFVDFSKNRWTKETIDLFKNLAEELGLKKAIQYYFKENKLNFTEDRAVLHTALRSNEKQIIVDGEDIITNVQKVKGDIKRFTDSVLDGSYLGYSGKAFTDVVNIGIGGSDLGPKLVCNALRYYRTHLNTHFVSNVDGDHLQEVLTKVDPETTLFIVVSKSFTTIETINNANAIRKWFVEYANEQAVAKHFVAVSANVDKAWEFGIGKDHVFPMWNWVGGRFSLWSGVGLSIVLALGYEKFSALLKGAQKVDQHFLETDFERNIPVLMAFLSVWYNNFFETQQEAVVPYTQYLEDLVPYLQQGFMESNGKSVDRNEERVTYQTGGVVFGGVGSNMQHAFFQLLHQGTKLIPTDFIGFCSSLHGNNKHHDILMANMFAQAEALAFGTKGKEADNKFKKFEGNKPSNTLLINKLSPETLGALLAIYEHKIFVQGILWNINSFDQFGVELGKEISKKIIQKLEGNGGHKVESPLLKFYNKI